ncbi:unnamed protein product [Tuber aestivum]|uniref:Uncharacterized protein n=1 Tax=Tuber aestivum TaxID=59557 RepID=A0A292PJ85_9PEZI|nr:unnamed protein product [Tuber aestivum]
MPPPFLTLDPRTSPITLSPFPSPKISPRSDTDDLGPSQDEDDSVSPLTPNDYSRLSGFPQLSGFDFAFDNRSSSDDPPSPSGPRRISEAASVEQLIRPASVARNSASSSSSSSSSAAPAAAPPPLSIVVPPSTAMGGVHRPAAAAEDSEAPPPYSRYAGASQPPAVLNPAWGGAAARVAGARNVSSMVPVAVYTRGQRGFAPVAGVPVNGNPRRQSGQRGLHALALADQSQQQGGQLSRRDSWREKITAGYWETEVEVETGSENKRLTRKGRRCIFAVMGLVLLVIIIIAVVVGVVTTRKDEDDSDDDDTSRKSANMESLLPELPEGTHVVKPRGIPEKLYSCVSNPSFWSCDLPSDSLFPKIVVPDGGPVLPEFRFTIRKETGSGSDMRANSTPAPENETDYTNVAEVDEVRADPKSGHMTNYYISLVTRDPSAIDQDPSRATDNETSSASLREPPRASEVNDSSKSPRKRGLRSKRQSPPASAKNMLPETIESQPLRFFDGGLETEHYGFHMYYTKTIRVTPPTESSTPDPAGGLTLNEGEGTDVRWERTRFKVVIWTKKLSDGRAVLVDPQGRKVQASADTDGFPYAVSIVQDRHGDRGPITPGPGLPEPVQEKLGESERCRCEWTNWRTNLRQ